MVGDNDTTLTKIQNFVKVKICPNNTCTVLSEINRNRGISTFLGGFPINRLVTGKMKLLEELKKFEGCEYKKTTASSQFRVTLTQKSELTGAVVN